MIIKPKYAKVKVKIIKKTVDSLPSSKFRKYLATSLTDLEKIRGSDAQFQLGKQTPIELSGG